MQECILFFFEKAQNLFARCSGVKEKLQHADDLSPFREEKHSVFSNRLARAAKFRAWNKI